MLRSTRCTNLTGSQPFDQSDRFGGWSVRFKDCTVYATMVVEDQSEGMGSNTSTVAGNFNSMADAKLRSEIPVKEIYSIGNYHSPKVVRGSSGSSEASMKSIEIPPPRPKRKPMHPYPRKSVDFLKGASVSNQPERSSSPISQLERKALTLLLQFYLLLVQKEWALQPQISTKALLHQLYQGYCVCKEEATEASASTSIKLFGRTFSLLDPQKDSFPGAEDFKLSTSKTDQANLDFENEKIVQTLPLDKLDTQLSLSGVGNWNTLACCAPVNQMEYQKESPNCTESDQPLLWWTLYQVPFYYLSAYNQNAVQTSPNSCVDERMKDKERSCTDSNEGSFGVENVGEKNMETVDSLCREPRVEESVSPSSSRKGFVPYKRCLAERDMKSPVIVLEERKRQRARVCS
ncbi:hypothetical protein FNV43_RR20927 [Rhamnella rubrinervis]|uniref:Uncharacterized protein n=1 Tax=Rhamnella rubrinervis TaxID=2594499 RepID=A0A8K0DWW3_9ROSA|nr:hypothetical protein FNV43_RR20927 [Rhamnella rubrinervis]